MTEYQIYREKQRILGECCYKVTPREFYDDIFPDEDLERPGHPEDERANPIIAYQFSYTTKDGKEKVGMYNQVLFQGKDGLAKADKSKFALCGLCTYSGRNRTARNAYKLYGFAFDLDGVGPAECETLLLGIQNKIFPCPQYIVNSGHGLHLYYLFQQPIPLYPNVRDHLQRLKTGLTKVIWTNETSSIKSTPSHDRRDYLGIYQNMRMPGSCSKLGKGKAKAKYLVTAYRYNSFTGARCTISYLNEFLSGWGLEQYRAPEDPDYSSWDYAGLSIDEAKRLYPEWYQRRIVEGKPAGQWVANRALYEWWLNRIQQADGARDGNRYHCVSILFIFAIKCDIPYDDVMADAMALVEPFNALTVKPSNEFTQEDVLNASEYYKRSYARYSINAIEARTGIKIPRRPERKHEQAEHLRRARAIRSVIGSYESVGRPAGTGTKADVVREWRKRHPEGTKRECERETGLSRHTVLRWWEEA